MENGRLGPCLKEPEEAWLAFTHPHATLESYDFGPAKLTQKKDILYWTLAGLGELHIRGIMHRSVNNRNILIFKDNIIRPRGCISDLGTAVKSDFSKDTNTSMNVHELAPEIFPVNGDIHSSEQGYNNKVDVWACAYSFIIALGFEPLEEEIHRPISMSVWLRLIQYLTRIKQSDKEMESYCDLLKKMLSWKPEERPSAIDALQSDLFTK